MEIIFNETFQSLKQEIPRFSARGAAVDIRRILEIAGEKYFRGEIIFARIFASKYEYTIFQLRSTERDFI